MALLFGAELAGHRIPPAGIALRVGLVGLVFGLGSLILFGAADLMLGLLSPRRSRGWAYAAAAISALLSTGSLAVLLSLEGNGGEIVDLDMLGFAGFGLAAGMVWWSGLPGEPAEVGKLFE